MKGMYTAVVAVLLGAGSARPAPAQRLQLDSLLLVHRHAVRLDAGRLSGPGADAILAAARTSQVVGLLEEHNVADLADFTVALFDTLQAAFGFRYLGVEQGSVIAEWLSAAARAGGLDSVHAIVRHWPQAPTFATDEELAMLAHVAAGSHASTNPIWGLDQELGALHILQRLTELAPSAAARTRTRELAAVARRYEADRFGDTLYLAQVATPDDFADLPRLFRPAPGSEAALLIEALQFTSRVYHNHVLALRGRPTGYENARERELGMKRRFVANYARARGTGDSLPRVLLKLGHWHLSRGIYRGNVPTLGNFASELATANGMEAFLLSTHVVDGPETWRNSGAFASFALPGERFTLIDFRPLRPYAHQGTIDGLTDAWKSLLFRADAALVIRGGRTGAYEVTRRASGR